MDIGTAITVLRKKKRISQKDFAPLCDISVNALCQIENNQSIPQKNTIKKICNALEVPVSYLLFFSISDEDIPEEKRKIFNTLSGTIREFLLEEIK